MKPLLSKEPAPGVRTCEWPDCRHEGEFPAPKDRTRLNDYYWFCLEHVRAYNAEWNYYAGMSDAEVEADVRRDTTWRRPTWKLGSGESAAWVHSRIRDPLGFAGMADDAPQPQQPPVSASVAIALDFFGLELPVESSDLRARYKALVKKHHPDANGGTKAAEEEFKKVQAAYQTLLEFLSR